MLYTLVGSLLMLVAILALYFQHGGATGVYTFDLPVLVRWVMPAGLGQNLMFLAFALAFAIKVPLFPFHTWLPDAHVEAPTPGSVILAGVLLKMGTYGFLRFCLPLFPDASLTFGPLVFALAVIGIIYGACVCTVQPDLKKLVAYSSVSHLGFVMLGIFTLTPQGLVGGVIQMVNHGLSTGRALPHGGHDLRAPSHAAHRRLRRAVDGDARLLGALPGGLPVVARPARTERLRGGVPHPAGRLPGEPACWPCWPRRASSWPPCTCSGCTSA